MGVDESRRADPERQALAREAARVVKQAASILESELAAGTIAADAMQRRLEEERKVDPDEFKALAQRVRKDVHDLISIGAELFAELQTDEVQGLARRLATDVHDVVDTTMNLVERTPDAANRLAAFGFLGPVPPGDQPVPPGDQPVPPGEQPVPPDAQPPFGPAVPPPDAGPET